MAMVVKTRMEQKVLALRLCALREQCSISAATIGELKMCAACALNTQSRKERCCREGVNQETVQLNWFFNLFSIVWQYNSAKEFPQIVCKEKKKKKCKRKREIQIKIENKKEKNENLKIKRTKRKHTNSYKKN